MLGGEQIKRKRGRPRLAETLLGVHRCIICKELKPLSEFYKDKTFHDGYGHRCKVCNKAYKKEYHAEYKTRDAVRKRRKARYHANREQELQAQRRNRLKNGHKWAATRRAKNSINPIPNMLRIAKARARRKGLVFDLREEDIFLPKDCPALGIPLIVSFGKVTENSPTLDRIDNKKGYTPDNVVIVSFKANTIKNNATINDLRSVLAFYERLIDG